MLEPPAKRPRRSLGNGSSDGDLASSQGSSTRDDYFHTSFVDAICAKHGKDIKGVVDAWDADGTKYQYIASMSQDEIDPVLIPEKIEPVKDRRVNRFFRKFGHRHFLFVKRETCPRFRLPDRLKPFLLYGREWELLGSRQPKKGRVSSDGDVDRRHTFIFWSHLDREPRLSAATVRRLHIPRELPNPGPGSIERRCDKHFFCRWLAGKHHEVMQNPEKELLQKGKYMARFKLGWTDAIPTRYIDPENILELSDLKASNGCVLSDGGGRLGLSLANQIREDLNLSYIPAVFQARIGSCKGLWVVDLDMDEDTIEIRKKQSKWDMNWHACDKEDRCFEVKDWSRQQAAEGVFNVQLIPILEARGVPADILLKLAIDEVGEIGTTLGGSGGDIAKSLPVYDTADPNRTQMSLQMIDAGIDVRSEPAAFKWCVGYLQGKVKSLRDKKHYKCPESWRAFIIPDFSQQLKPHEAIFWVSDSIGYLEGEALVARNPCTAPWDVQKLTFLGEAEILRRFGSVGLRFRHRCVVVLSASPDCRVSPADVLAGGDYDGDSVIVIFNKGIVKHFRACDLNESIQDEVKQMVDRIVENAKAPSSVKKDTVHDWLCDEHWFGSENAVLTAKTADWWTAIADEKGVNHPHAVKLGLLHQQALDSKLPCDKVPSDKFIEQISRELQIPPLDQAAMPHWHTRESAKAKGHIRQSCRVLGRLQNEVVPDHVARDWKKQYGGDLYQAVFQGTPPDAKPPHALEWSSFRTYTSRAESDLQDYYEKRKVEKMTDDGLSKLKAFCRDAYFEKSGCTSEDQKRAYATAFYQAQYQHVRTEWKRVKTEEQLEKFLLPAWELFANELCYVHMSVSERSSGICLMSKENRSQVQYRALSNLKATRAEGR
eukprot:s898_g7.t1